MFICWITHWLGGSPLDLSIGDLNYVLEGARHNATLLSLKGYCSSAGWHLYIVKLWTDHIHFCLTTLIQSHCFLRLGTLFCPIRGLTQGQVYAGQPYHWTSSWALLPHLFIFKLLNILDICISPWSKARVQGTQHYRCYQATLDTRFYKKTRRTEIQNSFIERIVYARIPIKGN